MWVISEHIICKNGCGGVVGNIAVCGIAEPDLKTTRNASGISVDFPGRSPEKRGVKNGLQ